MSREAFEAYFSEGGKWPKAVERSGDSYSLMQAAAAWRVWQEAERQCREQCALWLEPQRNDIPATGKEFAAALRAMEWRP
jgi:hypothetical protein